MPIVQYLLRIAAIQLQAHYIERFGGHHVIVLRMQRCHRVVGVQAHACLASVHVPFGAQPLCALPRAYRPRVIEAAVHQLDGVTLANRVESVVDGELVFSKVGGRRWMPVWNEKKCK